MNLDEIKVWPSVTDRPEITELIKAFHTQQKIEKEYTKQNVEHAAAKYTVDPEWIKASEYISYNTRYLAAVGPNKVNKENINKVIQSISVNGDKHFNMSTFFGLIGSEDEAEYFDERHSTVHNLSVNSIANIRNIFNTSTSSFNCKTVGCIAGFASAIALNWNDSLVKDIRRGMNSNRVWESIACNFMNIPLQIGEKIFFGEKGSVWSYLNLKCKKFRNLYYDDDTNYRIDQEYIYENDWTEIGIELASITHNNAIDLLTMIVNDEIIFNENWEPVLRENHRKECSQCLG